MAILDHTTRLALEAEGKAVASRGRELARGEGVPSSGSGVGRLRLGLTGADGRLAARFLGAAGSPGEPGDRSLHQPVETRSAPCWSTARPWTSCGPW